MRRFWVFINRHININMGVLSGIVTGTIVFIINISHGFWPAFGSFWKQFAFNLFMAGYNTKMCEKLSKSINNKWLAIFGATIFPTLIAFVVLYGIHYFGGTPKPMASTLWQGIANLFFFLVMSLIYANVLQIKDSSFKKVSKALKKRVLKPIMKRIRIQKTS